MAPAFALGLGCQELGVTARASDGVGAVKIEIPIVSRSFNSVLAMFFACCQPLRRDWVAKSSILHVGVTARACDGVGAVKMEFLALSR